MQIKQNIYEIVRLSTMTFITHTVIIHVVNSSNGYII